MGEGTRKCWLDIENGGENGYWIDTGTFETEAGRQTTTLQIPVSTIADGDVFACVIQSEEHGKTKEAPERKVVDLYSRSKFAMECCYLPYRWFIVF